VLYFFLLVKNIIAVSFRCRLCLIFARILFSAQLPVEQANVVKCVLSWTWFVLLNYERTTTTTTRDECERDWVNMHKCGKRRGKCFICSLSRVSSRTSSLSSSLRCLQFLNTPRQQKKKIRSLMCNREYIFTVKDCVKKVK
jgi:hypothetical protein